MRPPDWVRLGVVLTEKSAAETPLTDSLNWTLYVTLLLSVAATPHEDTTGARASRRSSCSTQLVHISLVCFRRCRRGEGLADVREDEKRRRSEKRFDNMIGFQRMIWLINAPRRAF